MLQALFSVVTWYKADLLWGHWKRCLWSCDKRYGCLWNRKVLSQGCPCIFPGWASSLHTWASLLRRAAGLGQPQASCEWGAWCFPAGQPVCPPSELGGAESREQPVLVLWICMFTWTNEDLSAPTVGSAPLLRYNLGEGKTTRNKR